MSEIGIQQNQVTCKKISSKHKVNGKQGLDYEVGISAASVGSTAIHMQLLTMPMSTRARS